MLDWILAVLFVVAGVAAAFFVRGRPGPTIMLLNGLILGFTISVALVILQRLILSHFFDVDFFPHVDAPLDLFLLGALNGGAFFAGSFLGRRLERYVAPERAARRRPPPEPPAPAPPGAAEPPNP